MHGSHTPVEKLHVRDGTLRIDSTGNTTNVPGLKIRERLGNGDYIQCGQFNDVGNDAATSGTDGNKFVVKNDGKVGVSNATPAYTLDITGDINFTGTLYENGTAFSGGGIGATDDVVCNSVTAGIGNGRSKIGDTSRFCTQRNESDRPASLS